MKSQRSIILGFIQIALWYIRNGDIRGTSDISTIEDKIKRLWKFVEIETIRQIVLLKTITQIFPEHSNENILSTYSVSTIKKPYTL